MSSTSEHPPENRSPITAARPLAELCWIPKAKHPSLARLGLVTVGDLLTHFPRRYEDRTTFSPFPDDSTANPVLVCGQVIKASYLPYGKWRRGYQAVIEEEGRGAMAGRLTCRWFNMPYVGKSIAVGLRMIAYGKTKIRGKQVIMDFPEFELIETPDEGSIHFDRIVPVHPGGEGVPAKRLREWIFRALGETDLSSIPSLVPDAPPLGDAAIRAIHFPASFADLESARAKLVFEELFGMQVLLASRRASHESRPGVVKLGRHRFLDAIKSRLGFEFTKAQARALAELRTDLASPRRMNRLLQGDVGSGKTAVALAAAAVALDCGHDVVFMVPTQILAEQHFKTCERLFADLNVGVALRLGGRRSGSAAPAEPSLPLESASKPSLIVGTHALLFESDEPLNPGLVIIDEQHKFGVMQRAALADAGGRADVLFMTATPIPRTLAQSVYGDLDVSTIDELPTGRLPVVTAVRPGSKQKEAAEFLLKHLQAGRQAYIVYPLIDESESLTAKAAATEFAQWQKALDPFTTALLHGRMKGEEKSGVMRAFVAGESQVLVSTTVIEVGVDVPNASVMLIENAERFGLAQLHQLRGRIGRGSHKSFCVILHGADAIPDAIDRLRVLESTHDGFAVAEADLALRGAGDLFGTAQSGLPPLRLADLRRDAEPLANARNVAQKIFRADPTLNNPHHAHLKAWIHQKLPQLPSIGNF